MLGEYESCVKKLDNLIDMRANSEISEEEFRNRKVVLLKEKDRMQEFLKDTDKRIENWLGIAERGINFAEKAQRVFATGSLEVKKEIFTALGSNFSLKDGKLHLSVDILLFAVNQLDQNATRVTTVLEPEKALATTAQNDPERTLRAHWFRDLDSNQDTCLQRAVSYR